MKIKSKNPVRKTRTEKAKITKRKVYVEESEGLVWRGGSMYVVVPGTVMEKRRK